MGQGNSQNRTVGERIQDSRLYLELTQLELGEKVGMERSAIGHIETGLRPIPSSRLVKFSDVLKVSVDWILRGKNY